MKNISTFMKGCLIAFLLLFTAVIDSNAQKKLSIQGFLKDGNGKAVDNGNYEITFKIYDVATAGTALWTESRPNVKVFGGVYSVNLGEVTSLDLLPFDKPYFVGITVANTEFTPRIELTYAPYALAVAGISGYNGSAKFASNGNLAVNGAGADFSLSSDFVVNGAVNTNFNQSGDFKINAASGASGTERFIVKSDGKFSLGAGANPSVFMAIGDASTGIDHPASGKLDFKTGGTTIMKMQNGMVNIGEAGSATRVGINTTNPLFPLHITAKLTNSGPGYASWFNSGAYSFSYTGQYYSGASEQPFNGMYVNGAILCSHPLTVAQEFTFSDQRIKKNINFSNSSDDLSLLNKIKIKDYEYIDKVHNSNPFQKKVIAQEVEAVFPQAVSKTQSVIPNVYEYAKQVEYKNGQLIITTGKAHEFTKGDKINLHTADGEITGTEVISVMNDYTFSVKSDKAVEKVFVHGKWINDFRTVDYDAISMLNVSATQELHKQIKALQEQNSKLREQNKKLIDVTSKIESRLEKLENASNYRSVSKTAATEDK